MLRLSPNEMAKKPKVLKKALKIQNIVFGQSSHTKGKLRFENLLIKNFEMKKE